MKEVAIISANLGKFDKQVDPVIQSINCDFIRYTDDNMVPRSKSMTPRMQSRIPKMFGWQLNPGYKYYIWIDGSFTLQNPDAVKWMIDVLDDHEIMFFKHPNRKTIREEFDYVKGRMGRDGGCRYLTPRYEGEVFDELMLLIDADESFVDTSLYCSGIFIHKNTRKTQDMMTDWWYYTSRYNSCDQLSLPYVLHKSICNEKILSDNPYTSPYLTFIRDPFHNTIENNPI